MKLLSVVISVLAVLPVSAADSQPFSPLPLQLEMAHHSPPIDLGIRVLDPLALAFSNPLVCAAKPRYVPVAFYLNRPDVADEDGRRAANLLHDNKIEFIFADSKGVMLAVSADQASKALRLLAAAVKAEHLRLTLIEMSAKGDWGAVATPESILDPKSDSMSR